MMMRQAARGSVLSRCKNCNRPTHSNDSGRNSRNWADTQRNRQTEGDVIFPVCHTLQRVNDEPPPEDHRRGGAVGWLVRRPAMGPSGCLRVPLHGRGVRRRRSVRCIPRADCCFLPSTSRPRSKRRRRVSSSVGEFRDAVGFQALIRRSVRVFFAGPHGSHDADPPDRSLQIPPTTPRRKYLPRRLT